MLFNEFALCHYLLENGFLNRQQLVDQQVRIVRLFSRNRNFKVLVNEGTGFLVKQPKLSFYLSKSDLKKEADIYWLAYNDEDFSSLGNFIPKFYHYDVHVQVLITGLVEPAVNLHEYHSMTNEYSEKIAYRQAEILTALHTISLKKIDNKKSSSLFTNKPAWLFNIESEDGWWGGRKSEANRQLRDLVKSNVDFIKCIREAKEKWKVKCLVHNDIRWTNFLVKENNAESIEIRLIDWELANFGDPCWDVAGILQAYFSYWILQYDGDPFQLLKMKPAISSFTNAYIDLMKLEQEAAHQMLQMSMEFTGVRMVQSCIEHVMFHDELDRKTVQLLQFALNILKNPKNAYNDFLSDRHKKIML